MHSTGPTTGRGDTVEMSDLCFDATVLYVEPRNGRHVDQP